MPVPTSTYRLQVHEGFGFDAAAQVVDHLAALGVTHLYLSPVLRANPGSVHGYDVVDHRVVSPEAGGREALSRLASRAHEAGLGIVVDVVPNHMAVPVPEHLNTPLWDVLRDGRESAYAHWFDVDWDAEDGHLLMPLLGGEPAEALEAGELVLAHDGGAAGDETVLRYYDHELPVAAGTQDLPLPDLLEAQHYRLTSWREARTRLNYRRFFDVTSLIAIRVEEPDVFDATHALLLELLADGTVDGFRIDHPDGLADPRGYLDRLAEASGDAWVVVEKILEGEERLQASWRTAGTTGYDALLRVQQVFVDPAGEAPLTALWHEQSSDLTPLADILVEAKAQVVEDVLPAEVERLTRNLERILSGSDLDEVRLALRELLIAMDRYRAYVVPGEEPDAEAVEVLRECARRARTNLARDDFPVLNTVAGLLSGAALPVGAATTDPDIADAIVRFQQTCGPVMAKGIEDTAFYRYARLTGLNEVGGDPGRFGIPVPELHAFSARLFADSPTTMTAASTHDTKRSEDVRARLSVISELPGEWRVWLERARELGASHRRRGVDGATEYLIWQSLVGAWPISPERFAGYVEKAVRESKARTTWTDPDETYESAVGRLVDGLMEDLVVHDHIASWVLATAGPTRVNTLGQKAIQLLMPGVPDTYQGTELVDQSLVDPDNRRPVDYAAGSARLARLDAGEPPADLSDEKLLLTSRVLRLRRDHPSWFVGPEATYAEVPAGTEHAVAFTRGDASGPAVVAVATRLSVSLDRAGGWDGHTLAVPEGAWEDVLTGTAYDAGPEGVPLATLLADLPVAVLVRAS